jgi:GNAT superfamily N-acetyltransferase
MDNKWEIREAVVEDSGKLRLMMERAYSIYTDRMKGQTLPPLEVDYKVEIENYPVWVVEMNGELVGGIILMYETEYCQIANIGVDTNFQGHGIGKGLLEFAESVAKKMGYSIIKLATHVLFTENLSYYKRLGWNETSREETRIYMEKSL